MYCGVTHSKIVSALCALYLKSLRNENTYVSLTGYCAPPCTYWTVVNTPKNIYKLSIRECALPVQPVQVSWTSARGTGTRAGYTCASRKNSAPVRRGECWNFPRVFAYRKSRFRYKWAKSVTVQRTFYHKKTQSAKEWIPTPQTSETYRPRG